MNKEVMRGPDISVHNGIIDFTKIKDKYGFVILRCGYGSDLVSQDDENFIRNADECERLDIPYGVYLYSYADTLKKAESEALHVLRLIKGRNIKMGVWYDMEDKIMPEDKELLTNIAITFLEKIENSGYYAGIYSTLSWFNTKLDSEKLDVYDKWVAQWNNEDNYHKPHGLWQFTSKANIEGLKGEFDMNIAYKDYPEITKNLKGTKIEPFKVKIKAKGSLNIRKGAGVNFAVTGKLNEGDIVTILSTENGWGEISDGGFISLNYTEVYKELLPGKYLTTAENGLNVRLERSIASPSLTKLPNNTEVTVKEIKDGWAEIDINLKAYLSTDYLKEIK